jgi:hypothetical protein
VGPGFKRERRLFVSGFHSPFPLLLPSLIETAQTLSEPLCLFSQLPFTLSMHPRLTRTPRPTRAPRPVGTRATWCARARMYP